MNFKWNGKQKLSFYLLTICEKCWRKIYWKCGFATFLPLTFTPILKPLNEKKKFQNLFQPKHCILCRHVQSWHLRHESISLFTLFIFNLYAPFYAIQHIAAAVLPLCIVVVKSHSAQCCAMASHRTERRGKNTLTKNILTTNGRFGKKKKNFTLKEKFSIHNFHY